MLKVKELPCCICGAHPPSDAHHVCHERYGTKKATDWDVIPLCKRHHQNGPTAIHVAKQAWREAYGPDFEYLEPTRKAVEMMEAKWTTI